MKIVNQIINPYIKGLHLGSYTYLFSNVLDYTISKETTLELLQKHPKLYVQSSISNFINLLGLSPIYYVIAENILLTNKSTEIQLFNWLGIVLTHNIIFYQLHKWFHEIKSLYFLHKFHHKFVKPVPSNGNAVSVHEYNIAYVMPFLLGAFLFKPNGITFQLAIATISFLNSFVHCPQVRNIRLPWIPFLVVPSDHLIHHEKLTTKYASPLLNVDYIARGFKVFHKSDPKYRQYKYTTSL